MKKIILALALVGILGSAVNATTTEEANGRIEMLAKKAAKKHKKGKSGAKVKRKKGHAAGSISKSRKWTSRGGHNGKRTVSGGKYMSSKARKQI